MLISLCTPDIIVFPESTKITANQQYSEVYREYGRFQCATRTGVFPLWVINGNSAASIKSEPGFENVTYNMYPIPENGTFTLLYVPGFVETNNSVIRCGAIVDSKVVAFSEAVNFTVYCELYLKQIQLTEVMHHRHDMGMGMGPGLPAVYRGNYPFNQFNN